MAVTRSTAHPQKHQRSWGPLHHILFWRPHILMCYSCCCLFLLGHVQWGFHQCKQTFHSLGPKHHNILEPKETRRTFHLQKHQHNDKNFQHILSQNYISWYGACCKRTTCWGMSSEDSIDEDRDSTIWAPEHHNTAEPINRDWRWVPDLDCWSRKH